MCKSDVDALLLWVTAAEDYRACLLLPRNMQLKGRSWTGTSIGYIRRGFDDCGFSPFVFLVEEQTQIVKAVRRQGLTFPASPILVVYALIAPFLVGWSKTAKLLISRHESSVLRKRKSVQLNLLSAQLPSCSLSLPQYLHISICQGTGEIDRIVGLSVVDYEM